MSEEIRIACEGAAELPLSEFVELQGPLKSLSNENYEKLKATIIEHGFSAPVSVWKDHKGKYRIIDGHQRIRVVRQLCSQDGFRAPKIPVAFVHANSEKEAVLKCLAAASAYGHAEDEGLYELMVKHKLTMGDVKNIELPKIELPKFAQNYFEEPTEGNIPDDEIPETRETSVKLGDLYQLGDHRLLCADCTVKENVERLMAGDKADMLLWDPPWNVGFKYNSHDDTIDNSKYGKFLSDSLDNFNWVSGPDFVAIVWQSEKNWTHFHHWFPNEARLVAVAKNFVSLAKHFVQRAWDPALMWVGKDYKYWQVEHHNQRDYFISNTAATFDDGSGIRASKHPCPRQVDAYEYFITGWSKIEASIVDFSAGSGTCFIACEKTNRKCYGMEIDPHYVSIIIERYLKFTGRNDVYRINDDGTKTQYKRD